MNVRVLCLICGWLALSPGAAVVGQVDFERPPIDYQNHPVRDAVYQLNQQLERGALKLQWQDDCGWLASLLTALDVPIDSQTLVFSKTSLQLHRISPAKPRALYFNDDVYVGWVQHGDVIELSAVDPEQGAVFYTVKQEQSDRPRIVRDQGQCLTCHASSKTQGVPGYLIRSVYPNAVGQPHFQLGTITTDLSTPFEKRFGGWYVTGRHGTMRHRGNVIARDDPIAPIDPEQGANLVDLGERFDVTPYLAVTSDLVALMVLEHQSQMHNRITRASFETRIALHQQQSINEALERDPDYLSDSTVRRIESVGDELLKGLLFAEETALTDEIAGNSTFCETFSAHGPRDTKRRSLREFDLKQRLFRYPCSYLIYSEAFDQLPPKVSDYIYRKLIEVLQADKPAPPFEHLDDSTRQAIWEILLDTKPEFRRQLQRFPKNVSSD